MMLYKELKRCDLCGEYFTEFEMETVFTGRRKWICYKCIREGRDQTGIRLCEMKKKKMRMDKNR